MIDTWDVINEVVIMPVFDKEPNGLTRLAWDRGRIPTIRLAFDAARQTNPTATLLLNDFDMSTAYECLIEGVLEAGIQVDAIGLQSHMHQGYWGEEKTLAHPRPVRALRAAAAPDRDDAALRRPHARAHRGPQRPPGRLVAVDPRG